MVVMLSQPDPFARTTKIEHVAEADEWLATGTGGTGFIHNQFDPLAALKKSSIENEQPSASAPAAVPKLDLTRLSATSGSLAVPVDTTAITGIDDSLPKPVKTDYTIDDFPMPQFQDIEVAQYKAPSPTQPTSTADNPYYTKESNPSGKLDLYQQQGWQWPPPGGVVGEDPIAPTLYKGSVEPRKHDSLTTIDDVNRESLAVIDNVANDLHVMALAALDEQAALEVAHVELSVEQYSEKLKSLAEMRRCMLSTVNSQIEKQKHQWGVKTKFYEADVESKRIFEEVQVRIARETQRRMDEAKKEVADQLANHAQSMMEAKKAEFFERVDSWYETARATAKDESATLFVVQQQQREALRAEFVARTKDHTKRLQAEEYKQAVAKAESINIRINLDEEFQQYCAKRRI